MALEYLLKGPVASGDKVTAEVKAKLSDDHVKVIVTTLIRCCQLQHNRANTVVGIFFWEGGVMLNVHVLF